MPLILLLLLATPQQFDKAGRDAYAALRDFQVEELRELKAQDRWPGAEHAAITAKLAIAREGIDDSLVFGADLAAGQPMTPQMSSLLRNVGAAVAALNGMVGPNASKSARKLMNTVQEKFAALFALFPGPGAKE